MITTTNIEQLIETKTGDKEVFLESITRANGDDVDVWNRTITSSNGDYGELILNIPIDADALIGYGYYNSKKEHGFKSLFASELIVYTREQKLNALGL